MARDKFGKKQESKIVVCKGFSGWEAIEQNQDRELLYDGGKDAHEVINNLVSTGVKRSRIDVRR
jgi:hypothetical protein